MILTIAAKHKFEEHLSVAPSVKCFLISMAKIKFFNLLILISHRGKSRTSRATKMKNFVPTVSHSQPLTVVTKNFVLDATGVLNPRDRL